MRQPLRDEKRVRRDAQRGVVMKATPTAAFEVIEPEFVLELLVVALDATAKLGQPDEIGAPRRGRQRGQPVLCRRGFLPGPLDEQPFLRAGSRSQLIAVGGTHAEAGEARA